MSDNFGISHLLEYFKQMGVKIAYIDRAQELIKLTFHGNHGQWNMIIHIQQSDEGKKLLLIVPYIGVVTAKKRLECLEALMAVNYRIAMGKFGLDLDDGEIRLEEAIPLAHNNITFEQFQMTFGAIIQTVAMYHSLLPRIIYGNLSVHETLEACEQEFLQEMEQVEPSTASTGLLATEEQIQEEKSSELDVNDILAEVTRLFEKRKD